MLARSRFLTLIGALLLAVLLGACSGEEGHRKAFIEFLQTNIVDKPGVRVVTLTPEQTKAIGDYANHYAVITSFHATLDTQLNKPMEETMKKLALRSPQDILQHQADIRAARETMGTLLTTIDAELARADQAHAALKQPEDLKAVYDKAYEKNVSKPAKGVREIALLAQQAMDSVLDISTFIDQNKGKISINGGRLETTDSDVLTALNGKLQKVNEQGQKLMEAQRTLYSQMAGS